MQQMVRLNKIMKFKILSPIVGAALLCSLQACDKGPEKIASVNGKAVTKVEFNNYLKVKRIPQQNDDLVKNSLNEYLEREGMARAIEDAGLLDKELLQAEIREYEKQLLLSRYFEQFLNEKVTEQALRNYYAAHKEEFAKKKIHVAHILVRKNKSMSEVEVQALKTKIHEAYTKLIQGQSFEEISEAYSEDKVTAKKSGDLGWITEGAIDPEFVRVAYALDVEGISEPIETNFGFHIIKLLEPEQLVQVPFEKVKGDIRYRLRQEAKQAEMERLKKNIKIERY